MDKQNKEIENIKKEMQEYGIRDFKKIKLENMVKYINEKHPEDKQWFKNIAYSKKEDNKNNEGKNNKKKYNHLFAVRCFCDRYCSYLIPHSKECKADTLLKDW